MRVCMLAAAAAMWVGAAQAQPLRSIFTDPPTDAANPASSQVLHIPSGGVQINGLAYVAVGAGPHPTVVLLHGLPGNEKNLDLAQAIRRSGWNAVTFNYRGSWGSPGTFSFTGNLDDAKAVLAHLRTPANAAALRVDPKRLVVMGHSMGGWVTSQVAAEDPALAGAALISAADMGKRAANPIERNTNIAAQNMESLAGVTAQSMAQEMGRLGPHSFAAAAPGLTKVPLLVLTSNDGLAADAQALVMDVKQRGGRVKVVHVATDHGWNSARIGLQSEIIGWLGALPK